MVSATKRKGPPNHTLLDFFPNSDAIKRTKVKTSQHQAHNSRLTKVISREVIIIDSDSDDDVHGRKAGPLNTGMTASEDFQSMESAAFTPACSGDKDAFGVPSELLQSPNPHEKVSSNSLRVREERAPVVSEPRQDMVPILDISDPFGGPTLLENQLEEWNRTNLVTPESTFNAAVVNSVYDRSLAEFPLEEWAAGDDELAGLDISDTSNGNNDGEPSNEPCTCPVCGMDLTGILILEAQTHANQCLDATSRKVSAVVQESRSTEAVIEPGSALDGSSILVKSQESDLYSVLMKSHKENEIWAEADVTINRDIKQSRGSRRKAPFYKVLEGMPIAVDAFCYGAIPGVTAYFLTHAHSDHYTSLGSKWRNGLIYCSEETANLIVHMLAVDPKWIHALPLDNPTIIPNTGGVSVTPIEANHCPGSCLFLFEGRQTFDAGDSAYKSRFIGSSKIFRYLHCGDFRASPRHIVHPAVKGKHIDHVYLDTTYLDPKYTFSPQPLVISACAELTKRLMVKDGGNTTIDAWMNYLSSSEREGGQTQQERILVTVGTYSIGKERIVKAIAQTLGTKIYCDPRKTAILRCQNDRELLALLTADPTEANLHILPLGAVTVDNLKSYLSRFKGTFSRVVGFRPTGWTYTPPSGTDPDPSIPSIISRGQSQHFSFKDLQPSSKSSHTVRIFGVPYSEHSSFFELTCFAMSCDWGRMIPTVNVGSPASRAKLNKWLKRWEWEKKNTKSSLIEPRTADYW